MSSGRGHALTDEAAQVCRIHVCSATPLREVARILFRVHERRSLVGVTLMTAQAFFYNAIFFTYALVLTDF